MTNPEKKFNWFSLLHFIPFAAFFIVSVVFRSEPLVRDLRGFFRPDKLISLRIIYGICFFLSITIYSLLAFLELGRHQKNLKNLVSYTSGVLTLNWLKIISVSFYLACFVLFILGGLNMIGNFIPFDPYFVIFGFITLFSFVFSFYGIKQPAIFGQQPGNIIDEKRDNEKYTKKRTEEEEHEGEYLSRLISWVESHKLYLDRDLSIYSLSRMTGIPRHYITQILNEKHGKIFYIYK
ncbi:MAG: hypothetical protein IPN67_19005 [Bacteroidales bacterium]|nr:hypothetical protein [Bacteroidales bacterium]